MCSGEEQVLDEGRNDPKLQHMFKLLLSCMEVLWCKTSGAGQDWRARGLDVMSDIMTDWAV